LVTRLDRDTQRGPRLLPDESQRKPGNHGHTYGVAEAIPGEVVVIGKRKEVADALQTRALPRCELADSDATVAAVNQKLLAAAAPGDAKTTGQSVGAEF
jgi:hypothetical protein